MSNIEQQIKKLSNLLLTGKAKNPFAIKNKIKNLQLLKTKQAYNEFLAR